MSLQEQYHLVPNDPEAPIKLQYHCGCFHVYPNVSDDELKYTSGRPFIQPKDHVHHNGLQEKNGGFSRIYTSDNTEVSYLIQKGDIYPFTVRTTRNDLVPYFRIDTPDENGYIDIDIGTGELEKVLGISYPLMKTIPFHVRPNESLLRPGMSAIKEQGITQMRAIAKQAKGFGF